MNCQRCGRWSYFKLETGTCPKCHQRAAKIERLAKRYAREMVDGTFSMRWAVIECYFRHKLSVQETAKVLGKTEEDVRFECDMARQDAR